jgi:hypothetical protein
VPSRNVLLVWEEKGCHPADLALKEIRAAARRRRVRPLLRRRQGRRLPDLPAATSARNEQPVCEQWRSTDSGGGCSPSIEDAR